MRSGSLGAFLAETVYQTLESALGLNETFERFKVSMDGAKIHFECKVMMGHPLENQRQCIYLCTDKNEMAQTVSFDVEIGEKEKCQAEASSANGSEN